MPDHFPDNDPIARALASLDRHRRDILTQYAVGMVACALLLVIGIWCGVM